MPATTSSSAAVMKLRTPLPRLKTTSDEICVRDNLAVRRTIRGHEEICLATVVEIKEVPVTEGTLIGYRRSSKELDEPKEQSLEPMQSEALGLELEPEPDHRELETLDQMVLDPEPECKEEHQDESQDEPMELGPSALQDPRELSLWDTADPMDEPKADEVPLNQPVDEPLAPVSIEEFSEEKEESCIKEPSPAGSAGPSSIRGSAEPKRSPGSAEPKRSPGFAEHIKSPGSTGPTIESVEPKRSPGSAVSFPGHEGGPSDSEPKVKYHKLYYVHYNGLDRRLDEWVDKSRIVDDESEYRPALTPAADAMTNKKLTRSQRRFQEEWNHLQKEFELDATTAKLEREHEERTKVKNIDVIQFGSFEIDTWYFSPFPISTVNEHSALFFCEFCLWYTTDLAKYRCHCNHFCKARRPPGVEIYRNKGPMATVAVYEVEGRTQKAYCQSLCLLSKLFLDHKTLYYDVESFMFYILCEIDPDGSAHTVGHFSKELRSENNLACIMVLPPFQRRGYGKLLIQLSYCLSEREEHVGTPEKPLSDLGKVSYRSYWLYVLLETLDATWKNEKRADENISVADLCRLSGIHVDDIIYTFNSLQLIKYWKGLELITFQQGDHVVRVNRSIIQACRNNLYHPPKLMLEKSAVRWEPSHRKFSQ